MSWRNTLSRRAVKVASETTLDVDDAIQAIVESQREGWGSGAECDLDIDKLLNNWAIRQAPAELQRDHGARDRFVQSQIVEWSPLFASAAWELCRRGILRPGCRRIIRGHPHTWLGFEFSITDFGRRWFADHHNAKDYAPSPADSRAQGIVERMAGVFGAGFHSRASEANLCYRMNAFLASCALYGAAAESVLLAVGSKRLGEDKSLRIYRRARGRSELAKAVFGGLPEGVSRELVGYLGVISHWRDASAHGADPGANEAEAFLAWTFLVRLGTRVLDNWQKFTT